MKKEQRNFHVPLPAVLYEQLKAESERVRQPATQLAREAIKRWLDQRRRQVLHQSIAIYAVEHGGFDVDLDLELENASVDHLVSIDNDP